MDMITAIGWDCRGVEVKRVREGESEGGGKGGVMAGKGSKG